MWAKRKCHQGRSTGPTPWTAVGRNSRPDSSESERLFGRLVDHDQWSEGEALEGSETGACGVKKVIHVDLPPKQVIVVTLRRGYDRIGDRFAGEEGRELRGAAGGSRCNLQEVVVQRFPAVATVAGVQRELPPRVIVVNGGGAIPRQLRVE